MSIGDYVVSGGELPTAIIIEAMARYWPDVLGNQISVFNDSFTTEPHLFEAPLFTRPQIWQNQRVPSQLLCGHHERIKHFRMAASVLVTLQKRSHLIKKLKWPKTKWLNIFKIIQHLSKDDIMSLGIKPQTIKKLTKMIERL